MQKQNLGADYTATSMIISLLFNYHLINWSVTTLISVLWFQKILYVVLLMV